MADTQGWTRTPDSEGYWLEVPDWYKVDPAEGLEMADVYYLKPDEGGDLRYQNGEPHEKDSWFFKLSGPVPAPPAGEVSE